MAFLWGLSSRQLFSVASSLPLVAQVLKKPSSSSLGRGGGSRRNSGCRIPTQLCSHHFCLPQAPLPLARGLVSPQDFSLLQPGALLSPSLSICSSWLLLPSPEEEISPSRGEGWAAELRPALHPRARHNARDGESLGWTKLLHHQPFPRDGGEGVRSLWSRCATCSEGLSVEGCTTYSRKSEDACLCLGAAYI